jgi:hypothetical protein
VTKKPGLVTQEAAELTKKRYILIVAKPLTNFFIFLSFLCLRWGMPLVSPSTDAKRINVYLLERGGS